MIPVPVYFLSGLSLFLAGMAVDVKSEKTKFWLSKISVYICFFNAFLTIYLIFMK